MLVTFWLSTDNFVGYNSFWGDAAAYKTKQINKSNASESASHEYSSSNRSGVKDKWNPSRFLVKEAREGHICSVLSWYNTSGKCLDTGRLQALHTHSKISQDFVCCILPTCSLNSCVVETKGAGYLIEDLYYAKERFTSSPRLELRLKGNSILWTPAWLQDYRVYCNGYSTKQRLLCSWRTYGRVSHRVRLIQSYLFTLAARNPAHCPHWTGPYQSLLDTSSVSEVFFKVILFYFWILWTNIFFLIIKTNNIWGDLRGISA